MPDILSFCNDAFECLSLHHDQAADIFLRHLAYGIVYGVRRTYRKNLVAFFTGNCLIVVTGSYLAYGWPQCALTRSLQ